MAKILVIDDFPPVLDVLRILLRQAGHEVIAVAGGAEALRLAGAAAFDLALIDVNMPGMDGIAVCEALKRGCGDGRPEVLMMTARPDQDAKLRARRAGALGVIDKPFDVPVLLDLVARSAAARTSALD